MAPDTVGNTESPPGVCWVFPQSISLKKLKFVSHYYVVKWPWQPDFNNTCRGISLPLHRSYHAGQPEQKSRRLCAQEAIIHAKNTPKVTVLGGLGPSGVSVLSLCTYPPRFLLRLARMVAAVEWEGNDSACVVEIRLPRPLHSQNTATKWGKCVSKVKKNTTFRFPSDPNSTAAILSSLLTILDS